MTAVERMAPRPEQLDRSRPGKLRRGPWGSVWLWRAVIPAIVIGIWQVAYHFEVATRVLLPSPRSVWNATVSLHKSGELWDNLSSTLQATVAALLLAAAIGIPLGILFGMLPRVWAVLGPYLNALNSMPRIALAPVFIVAFGITQTAKVAVGVSVALFIFMMNARLGVVSAESDHRDVCRTLGASKFQLFQKLYLPVAVPGIFAAFRLGMVYALLGVVSSEIIASRSGVGQLITTYSATLSMSYVYALLIVLAIFSVLLALLVGGLESVLLRWQRVGSHT